MKTILSAAIFVLGVSGLEAQPRYLSYDEARQALAAYGKEIDAAQWPDWVQSEDLAVRARLEQGEEDTLSNLLRFGVTFTKEYRITDEYLPKFGRSSLVNAFAENRADDLIRTLQAPTSGEGFREMRTFLEAKGYSLKTSADRARLKQYLLRNLARLRDDFLKAQGDEARHNRSHAFEDRGISLDTNLWPDYDLDVQLKKMLDSGLLRRGSVRRVAVVGPGLDFVNKLEGLDFYPPQTIQPFAVLDSLIRLGLSDPSAVRIYTLDISTRVNVHLARAGERSANGQPYLMQLPWQSAGRWTNEIRHDFTAYWRTLGNQIGTPTDPIPVPEAVEGIETRALKIRPEAVAHIHPLELNVVFQRLDPDMSFDLIIGTNIFVYYTEFQQSLARLNLAAMLEPSGFLISNDELAERVPAGLQLELKTEIPLTAEPVITEKVLSYRRQ